MFQTSVVNVVPFVGDLVHHGQSSIFSSSGFKTRPTESRINHQVFQLPGTNCPFLSCCLCRFFQICLEDVFFLSFFLD